MKLTKERALELHRQMWSDMQKDLGDCPNREERYSYKNNWIAKHFPNDFVYNDCFLCEYCANQQFPTGEDFDYDKCVCPIAWPNGRCEDDADNSWYNMPISELLALYERDDEADEEIEEEPADVKDGLYLCDLRYSAEGDCTGYMCLTEQEYETVKKVTNPANWQHVNDEGWSGHLSIYCKKLEEKK